MQFRCFPDDLGEVCPLCCQIPLKPCSSPREFRWDCEKFRSARSLRCFRRRDGPRAKQKTLGKNPRRARQGPWGRLDTSLPALPRGGPGPVRERSGRWARSVLAAEKAAERLVRTDPIGGAKHEKIENNARRRRGIRTRECGPTGEGGGLPVAPGGRYFRFSRASPRLLGRFARAVPQLFRPPGLIAPSAQSALSLGLASPGQRGQRCVQTTPGAPVLLASGFFPAFFCLALGPSLRLKQRRLLADLNFSQSQRNSLGLEQGLSGIWQQSGQTSPKSSGKHRNCIQRSRKWV